MRDRFRILWAPLLASLLAVPLAERAPEVLGSPAILRAVDAPDAVAHALPVPRFQPALYHRPPLDRHGSQLWSLLAPKPESHTFGLFYRPLGSDLDFSPLAVSARHFPLFPTGPPSLG